MNKNFNKIFMIVALNWDDIIQQKKIQNILDFKTNVLCRKIKMRNPSLTDDYIQMCTLSIMLMQLLCLNHNN